tara:strand:+ start:74732 stop:75559 length:828 start_codon:yes stop_codon:yes gene_type:complete
MITDTCVTLYEVGPRDGLQVLSHIVDRQVKVDLVRGLVDAGLTKIEVGSFVHPKLVPNMADSGDVFKEVKDLDAELGVLVPNNRGISRAKDAGATKFNIFYSPTNSFNIANHGKTYQEVVDHYYDSLWVTPKEDVRVYLSMAFNSNDDELHLAMKDAVALGSSVVLCDTDGQATPANISKGIAIAHSYTKSIALHLHSSADMMDNVEMAYKMGVREFDCSIGGMGGCPFVKGSMANLATEKMVQWCNERGIETGINLEALKPVLEIVKVIKGHVA